MHRTRTWIDYETVYVCRPLNEIWIWDPDDSQGTIENNWSSYDEIYVPVCKDWASPQLECPPACTCTLSMRIILTHTITPWNGCAVRDFVRRGVVRKFGGSTHFFEHDFKYLKWKSTITRLLYVNISCSKWSQKKNLLFFIASDCKLKNIYLYIIFSCLFILVYAIWLLFLSISSYFKWI